LQGEAIPSLTMEKLSTFQVLVLFCEGNVLQLTEGGIK
jgi:hypothetical protein